MKGYIFEYKGENTESDDIAECPNCNKKYDMSNAISICKDNVFITFECKCGETISFLVKIMSVNGIIFNFLSSGYKK